MEVNEDNRDPVVERRAQGVHDDAHHGQNVRENVRSQRNRGLSFIRFCNVTQRRVDVIWINYEGFRVKYKTLAPQEFFDVNTYVAHPWVFQDAVTHERLNANSKHIFQPGPWYEEYLPDLRTGRIQPQELQPKRVTVNITSPLQSLKYTAMKVVENCLTRSDQAMELEIPRQLQAELKDMILKKETRRIGVA